MLTLPGYDDWKCAPVTEAYWRAEREAEQEEEDRENYRKDVVFPGLRDIVKTLRSMLDDMPHKDRPLQRSITDLIEEAERIIE